MTDAAIRYFEARSEVGFVLFCVEADTDSSTLGHLLMLAETRKADRIVVRDRDLGIVFEATATVFEIQQAEYEARLAETHEPCETS